MTAMTGPRLGYLTLATPRSQVWDGTGWNTIAELLACPYDAHGLCARVVFDGGQVVHADMTAELWLRHPAR